MQNKEINMEKEFEFFFRWVNKFLWLFKQIVTHSVCFPANSNLNFLEIHS